jgi:benzodiazapine receptor
MYNQVWYDELNKSPITPPKWVFAPVWTLLYIIIFVVFIRASRQKYKQIYVALIFYSLSIFFNLIWTTLFFKHKQPLLALIDIILIISFTIISMVLFFKTDKTSFYLLIPYLLWLCFALYLNVYIVMNNDS